MSGNRISVGFLSTAQMHDAVRRSETARATFSARLMARLQAGKLDRMLAVGVPVPAGSALAVHAARLTSAEEREEIAHTLRHAVARRERPSRAVDVADTAQRAQHRCRQGPNRPGHPAAAVSAAGAPRAVSRDCAWCSPTASGRCTATAVATSRVGSGAALAAL